MISLSGLLPVYDNNLTFGGTVYSVSTDESFIFKDSVFTLSMGFWDRITNRHKESNDPIESWFLRIQKRITYGLFLMFFLLLAVNIYDTTRFERVTGIFLSVITGWIGIVMGMFFSKSIEKHLEDRLKNGIGTTLTDLDKTNEKIDFLELTIGKLQDEIQSKERLINRQTAIITILSDKKKGDISGRAT